MVGILIFFDISGIFFNSVCRSEDLLFLVVLMMILSFLILNLKLRFFREKDLGFFVVLLFFDERFVVLFCFG